MSNFKNFQKLLLITVLLVFQGLASNAQYCSINFSSGVEPITLVNFGSINNATPNTIPGGNAYDDFTAISTNVIQGQTYSITVKSNTDGNYSNYARVFIDWNQNNVFTDAGESFDVGIITNSTGLDAVQASANILIPFTSNLGSIRMRVTAKYSAYVAGGCNTSGWGQAEDYTLNVLAGNTCSGTPTAGTASGPSAVCPSASFTLSLTGYTSASGISIQWQNNTGSGWQAISGATNTTYTASAGITSPTDYRAVVTCSNGNGSDISNTLSLAVNSFTQCYCAISFTSGIEPITYVHFAGIDNVTAATSTTGVENFTATSATLSLGASYPITVKANTFGNFSDYVRVFFDWNHNGSFADAGESFNVGILTNSTGSDEISVTTNIAVPGTALTGTTRMRVVKLYAAYASPCNTSGWGQAEEYTVSVCDNAPVSPTTIASLTLVTPATTTAQKISFTRGNGSGAIVLARSLLAPSDPPASDVVYTVASPGYYNSSNPDWGGGKVIYNSGAITTGGTVTIDVKYLPSGAPIVYQVYEYNGSCVNPMPIAVDTFYTLMAIPSKAAKLNSFSNVLPYSFTVSWTNGGGTHRTVLMKEGAAVDAAPANNTIYTANTVFGTGTQLGTGNYVVYDGTGSSVTVKGLKAYTVYHVAVFEYNGPDMNGDIVYQAIAPAIKSGLSGSDFAEWTQSGVSRLETFDDSLLITGTGSRMPKGWFLSETGTGGNTTYTAGTGSSTTGDTYSFGLTSTTDRAFGTLLSTTVAPQIGVRLRNNTKKDTVTSLMIIYNGEQWRRGNTTAGARDSLQCYYSVDPNTTRLSNGTWIRSANLDFYSQITTAATATLNGNLAANRKQITGSITGLSIPPGGYIWIKFADKDLTGSDDGLALDDFEVIPFTKTVSGGGVIPALASLNDLNIVGGTAVIDAVLGKLTVKNALNIEAGSVLSMGAAAVPSLTIGGMLYGTGNISASSTSKLTVAGSNLNQRLYLSSGFNTIGSLTLKGGASATLGNTVNIAAVPKAGVVKVGDAVTPATLTTGGNLTLKSDTLGTAMIDDVYGSVTGNVNVERALQQRPGIRLLSHPFSTAMGVTGITGYTPASLWYYDAATASPNGVNDLANDALWTAAVPATAIAPYGVLRLMKDATPGAVMTISGPVNQGNIAVTVPVAADSFVVLGNPYPAGVSLGNALAGAGGNFNNAAIYTWDPTKGSVGAFVTVPNSKFPAAKLPIGGSFVAVLNPCCGAATFNFTEADKTGTGNTKTFFKSDGEEAEVAVETPRPVLPEGLQLTISRNGNEYDGLYIYFDAGAAAHAERNIDAAKINNPGTDFYTRSAEGSRLSVDVRPFENGRRIPLGLSKTEQGQYTMSVSDWHLKPGTELYLVDSYTGMETLLEARSSYTFDADGSQAENRFHLRMGSSQSSALAISLELMPNPAKDMVTIRLNAEEGSRAEVRILALTGQQLMKADMASSAHGQISLPLNNLSAGIYMVEVTVNGQKITKQLVKQ